MQTLSNIGIKVDKINPKRILKAFKKLGVDTSLCSGNIFEASGVYYIAKENILYYKYSLDEVFQTFKSEGIALKLVSIQELETLVEILALPEYYDFGTGIKISTLSSDNIPVYIGVKYAPEQFANKCLVVNDKYEVEVAKYNNKTILQFKRKQ